MLKPPFASCSANSLPIPSEAPVTTAHAPFLAPNLLSWVIVNTCTAAWHRIGRTLYPERTKVCKKKEVAEMADFSSPYAPRAASTVSTGGWLLTVKRLGMGISPGFRAHRFPAPGAHNFERYPRKTWRLGWWSLDESSVYALGRDVVSLPASYPSYFDRRFTCPILIHHHQWHLSGI